MMTYFANGREVDRDLSKFSNVIPVHIKCIDWYVVLTLLCISAYALATELICIGAREILFQDSESFLRG